MPYRNSTGVGASTLLIASLAGGSLWHSAADATAINGEISGNVAFSPYLDNGNNNNSSLAALVARSGDRP
ncbi:MAG: hypothetical protein ACREHD_25625 [Pirellulales bacterium]